MARFTANQEWSKNLTTMKSCRYRDLRKVTSLTCFRSTNYQSFDLGFDPTIVDSGEIKKAIEKIAKEVDLVLLAEYFEESLVLLKVILSFVISDIMLGFFYKRRLTVLCCMVC